MCVFVNEFAYVCIYIGVCMYIFRSNTCFCVFCMVLHPHKSCFVGWTSLEFICRLKGQFERDQVNCPLFVSSLVTFSPN